MRTLWQDIRFAARVLRKTPGFTVVAVLSLALGVGANASLFSVVNAVLLRPLPYPEAERIVTIWRADVRNPDDKQTVAAQDFADWRSDNNVFEGLSAYHFQSFALTGVGEPERIGGARVTAEFTRVIGVAPVAGRAFLLEEDKSKARVAIISDRLRQRRFAADSIVLGKTLVLNGEPHTIVGVMPSDFRFPSNSVEVWTPADLNYARQPDSVIAYLSVIARLKPGVTLERAQAEMDAISRRLAEAYPNTNKNAGARLVPLHEQTVGGIRLTLLVLVGAVGMVLLIACANVANLFLARSAARRREIALRTALGASRVRIMRQLLVESTLLALLGGVAGLLLAVWGVELLTSTVTSGVPRLREVGVDGRVLGFTFVVSVLTGIVSGFIPALHSSKADLTASLKEGSRGQTAGAHQSRLRASLVVAQIALALVLTIGAGLFLKSFRQLRRLDAGFDPAHVLTLQVSLPAAKYQEGHRQIAFFDSALARIENLPGVRAAGVVTNLPLGNSKEASSFDVAGEASDNSDADRHANVSTISPGYFRAMDISLERGRAFADTDRRNTPGVVIINEAFARRYFGGADPLGRKIILGGAQERELYGTSIEREIVGIAEDARFELETKAAPEMYVPHAQRPMDEMTVVIRAASDPASLTPAVREAVRAIDVEQPIHGVKTMEQRLAESIAPRSLVTTLTILFAFVALALAGVGIYGVMAYTVAARTHEIGVRMALGAGRGDVLRLVVRQGMTLGIIGVVLGLVGALALTRVMTSLLYGVSATDPATFTAVAVLLAVVALLACYVPARRATKVDPLVALRYE